MVEPILYKTRDNPILINEQIVIRGSKAILKEVPDRFYKVQINGYTEVNEIDHLNISYGHFYVDYLMGEIHFTTSVSNDTQLTATYYGTGYSLYPASRMYLHLQDHDTIEETLQDALTKAEKGIRITNEIADIDDYVNEGKILRSDLIKNISDAPPLIQSLSDNISSGNIVKTNLENAIANGDLENRFNNVNVELADIAKISIYANIDSTTYKAGQKVDIDYLRSVQAKKYALVMRKLHTGQSVILNCQGDSLTRGYDEYSTDKIGGLQTADDGSTDTHNIASKTYPEALKEYLGQVYGVDKITVINKGFSGDYASGSYSRWYKKNNGDLTIIMLGSNDARSNTACPYGGDVETYLYWMEQLIIRELIWGKAVILLTPPKTRLAGTEFIGASDIETFANALFLLGQKYNVPVVNTQEFHANHSYTVYSDAIHFNADGYKVLAAKVSSLFIGEGLSNPKIVGQGSTLLTRPMLDGVRYINNATFESAGTTESPDENATDQGLFASITSGGSIIYSFYNTDDNLVLFPSFLLLAGGTVNITIDYNVLSPQRSLDSAYFQSKTQHEDLIKNISYTGLTVYNKTITLSRGDTPLMITNKGWHTIKVEVTGSSVYFYGFELMGYQEYYNLVNVGSIKETQLYGGSVSSGVVALTGDISQYNLLVVQTGSATDGTLQTAFCQGFNKANFRPGTDWIRVPTAAGSFVAKIDTSNQITIQGTANNPLRYIYGTKAF